MLAIVAITGIITPEVTATRASKSAKGKLTDEQLTSSYLDSIRGSEVRHNHPLMEIT